MSKSVQCPEEGVLRAYLDGALAAPEQEITAMHVAGCSDCRHALAALSQNADGVRDALTSAAPAPARFASSALAWQRFTSETAPRASEPVHRRLQTMWHRARFQHWRPAFAGMLALLLTGVLLFTPVGAAASRFLGIFRVQSFAVVEVNSQQLEQLRSYEESVVGRPQFDKVEPKALPDASAATAAAGFPVLTPGTLPANVAGPARFEVTNATQARTTVNIAAARTMLQAAGLSTAGLPANMNQAEISASIPPIVAQMYGSHERPLVIVQANSPTVNVPDGIDMTAVGEQGLRLLGMNATAAHQLAQKIDWATTLIVPVPTDLASVQQLTVRGVDAYFFRSSGRAPAGADGYQGAIPTGNVLLWNANGRIYAVGGNFSQGELMDVANSLK